MLRSLPILALGALCALAQPEEKRTPRLVDDPDVVEAAEVSSALGEGSLSARVTPARPQFALRELRSLSDSGIYRTLELVEIMQAASGDGVFHHNMFLKVKLTSPHLEDESKQSVHDVMVMTSYDDGVRSFAIDEFPLMEEDAIEQFWIEKVEEHRRRRDESFAEMEAAVDQLLQAHLDGEEDPFLASRRDPAVPVAPDELQRVSTGELLDRVQHDKCPDEERELLRDEIDRRYREAQAYEQLRRKPTRELRRLMRSDDTDSTTRRLAEQVLEGRWKAVEQKERDGAGQSREGAGGEGSGAGTGAGRETEGKDEL